MKTFQDKVILITGGAKGIGAATAHILNARGASIYLTDIDEASGKATASKLKNSHFALHDTTSKEQWKSVLADCAERFGRLDGVVNNAGIAISETLLDVSDDSYNKQMDINVKGVVYGCQLSLPYMAEKGGAIVNLSSIASLQGSATLSIYCATKGAVSAFTRAVAAECSAGEVNIRCNAVCPGIIDTAIWDDILQDSPMGEMLQSRMSEMGNNDPISAGLIAATNVPAGKLGVPKDIGNTIAFLLSDDASYVNGHCMVVDYGLTN